jgi:hypothetical protein
LFTAVAVNGGSSPAYQWKVNGSNVGVNSSTYSSTSLANNDIVTCVLTSNAACATTATATSNPVTMTISPNTTPTVTISTTTNTVCSSTPVTFTATALSAGGSPTYQWKKNGVNVGTNSTTYSSSALADNDAVSCVVTSSAACANPLTATSNTILMAVSPSVTPSVSISATSTSICAAQSITFTATPVNGGTAPTYQWKKNGSNVGTGSITYTASALANNDVITCEMTGNAPCASTSTVTSNSLTITVNTSVTPTVSITSSATTICSGTLVTFSSLVTNGGGVPGYVWKINGNTAVGATASSYTTDSLHNGDVVTCQVTSSAACASPLTASSNSITMTVSTSVTASVAISASATSICTGTQVTFTAVPNNGGSTPAYQWKVNGNNVGSNSNTYSSTTLNDNDAVTCVLTSNATCVTAPTVVSNTIAMIVNTPAAATVTITGNNTICAGTSATFNATVTNAGSSPVYQWKINSANAGTNSSSFTTTLLGNGDLVTCVFTSVNGCSGTNSATSNTITMSVAPSVAPDVVINASTTSICSGQNVVFTATPTNGGTNPNYHWFKNGATVGTNNFTYSSTTLADNDEVHLVLTSNATCAVPATDTSNSITITVGSNATPGVSITASANNICTGTAVTYTATPVNGGSTPSYQWKVNTSNVGTNSPSFTSSALANGDVVTCIMTSNASCVSTTTATSNAVTVIVSPTVSPSVSVSPSATDICIGTGVTFTATPTNGGSTPAYQWLVNGNNSGTNSNVFTTTALANGDAVSVIMTSSAACPSVPTATSSPISITVNPTSAPAVTISPSSNNICAGTSVTFTAVPSNGGVTPTYQWKVNGANTGGNSATFTSNTLNDADAVTCVLTSSSTCAAPNFATSNSVTMNITPNVVPTIMVSNSGGICSGSVATFNAAITNGGTAPAYQWKLNGANVGSNINTYSSATLVNGDIVSCELTSNANCASPTVVVSNQFAVNVLPNVTPSITINASATTICSATTVTFNAVPANGGNAPAYQWKLNGADVGTNASSYSNAALANGDVVSCVLTSNAACVTQTTATSNNVTISVGTAVVPAVTIAATATNICAGSSVTFTATPVNPGNTPIYAWTVNGIASGSNSATFTTSTLNNTDVVVCTMTSNEPCASPLAVASNSITVTVNSISQPTVSITASQNPVCTSTSVTYTATSANAGGNPVYTWKVNGGTVGVNSSTYTAAAPADGDIVTCEVTSTDACTNGMVVTSNTVVMGVSSSLTPTVTVAASATSICSGENVTFTATPVNGGTSPIYQWKVNGANAGVNAATFSTTTLANNDVVTVEMTSSAVCASVNTVTSNSTTITVGTSVTASVSVGVTPATQVCYGTNMLFTATPVNGGTTPTYQWKLNGSPVGTNSNIYSGNTFADGDILSVNMTSTASCVTQPVVNSSPQVLTIYALPAAPTISQSGNVLTSSAVTGNQWYQSNLPISGANAQTYAVSNNGWYAVEVTNTDGCSNKSDSLFIQFTGINEISLNEAISILPNPFYKEFTVAISDKMRVLDGMVLTVTDATGRLIYEKRDVQYRNLINLSDHAAGVYYVRIYSGTEQSVYKVVKQN